MEHLLKWEYTFLEEPQPEVKLVLRQVGGINGVLFENTWTTRTIANAE